jgi:hypothetical protein
MFYLGEPHNVKYGSHCVSSQFLRTCTTVYYEAVDILYGENTLYFPIRSLDGTSEKARKNLFSNGPLNRIKHIAFDVDFVHRDDCINIQALRQLKGLDDVYLYTDVCGCTGPPTTEADGNVLVLEAISKSEYHPRHPRGHMTAEDFQTSALKDLLDQFSTKSLRVILRVSKNISIRLCHQTPTDLSARVASLGISIAWSHTPFAMT